MAENTGTFYLEEIMKKFPLEERTYRFRCVHKSMNGIDVSIFDKLIEVVVVSSIVLLGHFSVQGILGIQTSRVKLIHPLKGETGSIF
ncbi:MAG: hypothetical protein AAFR66_24840 [Bacteroidota bacterium]